MKIIKEYLERKFTKTRVDEVRLPTGVVCYHYECGRVEVVVEY